MFYPNTQSLNAFWFRRDMDSITEGKTKQIILLALDEISEKDIGTYVGMTVNQVKNVTKRYGRTIATGLECGYDRQKYLSIAA